MADAKQTANLDATISALQGDITSIPAEQVIAVIDSWQQQLEGNDIAEDLGELKQALNSGDKASISRILADLGEDTKGAAADATGDVATKVKKLGDLLLKAGNAIK
ncbi:hypothetical protein [Mastigocladopsis repens]|uniref:hypothetical protein n=1 Tax=Mastigocladopsis repens TaxID=221287 RepID=UPI00031CB718|nr:hypothetical protein [Mastigocladopsis repens]